MPDASTILDPAPATTRQAPADESAGGPPPAGDAAPAKRPRKKRWLLLVAVLIGAAALVYGFLPKPLVVEMAPVVRGSLAVVLEEDGQTRVQERYVISAPVAGYARRAALDVGDAVTAGDILLTVEPARSTPLDARSRAEALARVRAAEAALRTAEAEQPAAEAEAALARADLERMEALFAAEIISRQEFEQIQTRAQQAEAQQRAATAAVEVARYNRDAAQTALTFAESETTSGLVELRAPIAGRVLALYHESEGAVAPGQAVAEVGDPQALEVAVDVLSSDAVQIEPGMRVLFRRWGGTTVLEGRVRIVEPVGFTKISALGVEEQRVWVVADLTSPPAAWARLGDGYRVEAQFVLWEGEDVLQIPSSALFQADDGWAVFVAADGTARRRPVTVGHRAGLRAEILDGLSVDEWVIPHPPDALADGQRVEEQD